MKKVFAKAAFILLCGLAACNPHKSDMELETMNYELVERLTEFPDSTFFTEITHAEYENGRIYLIDKKRGDVVALTEDFKQIECIAPHSEIDLVMPIAFTVWQDTVYICDEGSINTLKVYTKGKQISSLSSVRFYEKRMAVNNTALYTTFPTDSSCYLKINRHDTEKRAYEGKVVKEENERRTIMKNEKHLFLNNGILYTVAECYPYIDSYNAKTGKWIKNLDISHIPVIQSNISFIESQPVEPKSYYVYMEDGDIHNNFLYLLCASLGDNNNYRCNTLLKVDVSNEDMKPVGYYELPGRFYTAICVSDNYLYAIYSDKDCAIEKYKLKQ